jgi:sarcosine oxidase gamma subunit
VNVDLRILGVATEEETQAVQLAVRTVLAATARQAAPTWERPARYRAPNSWTARRGAPLSRPDAFA